MFLFSVIGAIKIRDDDDDDDAFLLYLATRCISTLVPYLTIP